jgi:hypothetical protein
MARGIKSAGDAAIMRDARDFDMSKFDAAVFWGFTTECQRLVAECIKHGIPWIYLDLAYWLREQHFKVTINDRHPNAYFMLRDMPHDRFNSFGLKISPWADKKPDSPIMLAGMSGKAAWSWGMKPEEFERKFIPEIAKHTSREIIYRPKPSFRESTKLPGAQLDKSPEYKLAGLHAVVTHHSNVGIDALMAGIPVFCRRGAAQPLALSVDSDLSRIEEPIYPEGREQLFANLAYCQWSLAEMISGKCWRHLRELMSAASNTEIAAQGGAV